MIVAREQLRPQLILAAAMFIFGFSLVAQLRSYEKLSERLEAERETDLVEIVDRVSGEIRLSRSELLKARLRLEELKKIRGDEEALARKTTEEITELKAITGLAPVSGEGIIININDNQELLTGFDLRQIVEELRATGAWAIQINGRRVDGRSSFWRSKGALYVDGSRLDGRFRVEALGDSRVLYQAITLPRGIRDKLETIKGVSARVKTEKVINVNKAKDRGALKYVKPAD